MRVTTIIQTARRRFLSAEQERGQGLVEYALIIALVSLAAIAALGFMSGKIQSVFSKTGNSLAAVCVSNPDGSCDGSSSGSTPPPPPPPPAPVPTPGTVTISPSTEQGSTPASFSATTGGWANSPTEYQFSWQRTPEGSCTGFVEYELDTFAASVSQTGGTPGGNSANDRCYQVVVTARNASGSSVTFATSLAVLVAQGINSVTAAVSPSAAQFDGVLLTGSGTPDHYASSVTYQWQGKSRSESDTDCGSSSNGWSNISGATTSTHTTASGTTSDFCYRVVVTADNAATSGNVSGTSNAVFVEGNG